MGNVASQNNAANKRKLTTMIKLTINGELQQFNEPLLVVNLIEILGYTGKRIALERNGDIVPRSTYSQVQLADGDKLEVVVAVGGG